MAGFSHVALTVGNIERSKTFYTDVLGMPVLDSSATYCALLTGSDDLSALILTTHDGTAFEPFSELRIGLDHVSFAIPDEDALAGWQQRLHDRGVPFDLRRSEWGHHLNLRDPDNVAVELVLVQPDADVQATLNAANV
ncbi:MAG TPA: VOC family protein [Acidimicrobiales bacterium]|nr:VOC family protein [Acidimicrobiales bacterium]